MGAIQMTKPKTTGVDWTLRIIIGFVVLIILSMLAKCTENVIVGQNDYVECTQNRASQRFNNYEFVGDRVIVVDRVGKMINYPIYSCVEVKKIN